VPPLAPLAGGRAGKAKTLTQPTPLSRRGGAEASARERWKQVADAVNYKPYSLHS
jgi:hypothetical protein